MSGVAPRGDGGPATAPLPSRPEYGETWVYESIVGALPGVELSERASALAQFLVFEALVLLLAAVYGLWSAVPAGTAAVVVATGGSALMRRMGRRVRAADVPASYTGLLFGSSIEVVLGLLLYVALVTYLFVVDPRPGSVLPWLSAGNTPPLLVQLLGQRPPAPAVFVVLLVLWDVSYRIGTAWWACVVGLWRSFRFQFAPATARELRAVDRLNLGFGLLQLALLPFLLGDPFLAAALVGHVVAVLLVAGLSLVLLGRDNGGRVSRP